MSEQLALGFEDPQHRDALDLVAGEVARLGAENRALVARVHALEVMFARLSHAPEDPATRARRTVDDRGHIVLLRDPAAAIRKAS